MLSQEDADAGCHTWAIGLVFGECVCHRMLHRRTRARRRHWPVSIPSAKFAEDQAEISRKLAGVLKLAADASGWGKALPPGKGRGIACSQFGQTWLAQVAEVLVDKAGKVRVKRVVAAVDCGVAINPDSVRALIAGGINYARKGFCTRKNDRRQDPQLAAFATPSVLRLA